MVLGIQCNDLIYCICCKIISTVSWCHIHYHTVTDPFLMMRRFNIYCLSNCLSKTYSCLLYSPCYTLHPQNLIYFKTEDGIFWPISWTSIFPSGNHQSALSKSKTFSFFYSITKWDNMVFFFLWFISPSIIPCRYNPCCCKQQ